MKPELWKFPERDADPASELWLPEDASAPAPAIVLAPDLLGRPGHGLASALGPELAKRGFVTLAAAPTAGCDTPRFKEATLRERVGDVARAVTALFERMAAAGKVDIRKIALVGHGVGGTVAIAEAAHDSRVGAVAAIGAPRSPAGYFAKKDVAAWQKGASAALRDAATGEEHELGPELWRDWKARESELDHANGATKTDAHVLWVHGTDDEQVAVDDSRRAYWKHPEAGRRARLVEIAGAKHDFGVAADPSAHGAELSPQARRLADAVADMLETAFPKKS